MKSPFISWCASQGIITPLTLYGESSTHRYMVYDNPNFSITSSPTISGNILQVPFKACIIADTTENLSIKLAYERDLGVDSLYAPYIDVLPKLEEELEYYDDEKQKKKYSGSLSSLPQFWDEERIGIVTDGDGGQLERKLKEDEREGLDPWAYACVTSRANYIMGHGYAMTPILDMMNHDSSVSTSAKIVSDSGDKSKSSSNDNVLELSIQETFSIGDEVCISYGDLTNLETLSNYGFVSEKNKCNKESFDVFMMRKPPVQVTIYDHDGSIDEVSLATLRSYLVTPNDIENIGTNNFFRSPISDSNEEEVYSFIASFIDEAISDSYETAEKVYDKDELVYKYLVCRGDTLKKGLDTIKAKFPNVEF